MKRRQGAAMTAPKANPLAAITTHSGLASYWELGGQAYRLAQYEPVRFDIYGLPLGARWECSREHWERFKNVILGEN